VNFSAQNKNNSRERLILSDKNYSKIEEVRKENLVQGEKKIDTEITNVIHQSFITEEKNHKVRYIYVHKYQDTKR